MPRAEVVHRDGGPGRKQLPDKQGNPVGAPQAAAFGELEGQPGAGTPFSRAMRAKRSARSGAATCSTFRTPSTAPVTGCSGFTRTGTYT